MRCSLSCLLALLTSCEPPLARVRNMQASAAPPPLAILEQPGGDKGIRYHHGYAAILVVVTGTLPMIVLGAPQMQFVSVALAHATATCHCWYGYPLTIVRACFSDRVADDSKRAGRE